MKTHSIRIVFAGSAALLASLPAIALASGFQLLEQNASGMGQAYAGTAAVAEDASTVFFNPAGMALLAPGKTHVAVGLDFVQPSAKFSNGGSTAPARLALTGGDGGDAGSMNTIPHGYVVVPINDRMSFGLGLGVPFGLKTEYAPTWMGRFLAIKSDVKTINLNPSLSYRVNDDVALGFGLDYQKLRGEFSSAVNFPAAIYASTYHTLSSTLPAGAANLLASGMAALAKEGSATVSGDDTVWSYNFGMTWQVTPETRVGAAYRSATKYHLEGNASFSGTGNPVTDALVKLPVSPARGGNITADIKLPDTLTLSLDHHLSGQWEVLADLAWTGWSKIPVLQFNYANNNASLASTPENWRDTWRAAFGGIYRASDQWKLRMGIAYDQSPVSDAYRTPRLPDNNRLWLSLGGQYRFDKDSALDVSYAHIFVKDSSISDPGGDPALNGYADPGKLQGSYKNHVDMLGVQYSQGF